VEQDVGLHGRDVGEAGDACGLVQEVCPCDSAVAALGGGVLDNHLEHVHFSYHVLEGAHVCVRDLCAGRDVAQRVQVAEEVVRQLVPGRLEDDALELLGLDVAVAVLVKVLKGLSHAFALQTTQHLRELRVREIMPLLPAARVQGSPGRVPVEGNGVGTPVGGQDLVEVVELDHACALDIEQTEGDFVLGVGLREEVGEVAPVGQTDCAGTSAVSHLE
jgi:hypothetical protein